MTAIYTIETPRTRMEKCNPIWSTTEASKKNLNILFHSNLHLRNSISAVRKAELTQNVPDNVHCRTPALDIIQITQVLSVIKHANRHHLPTLSTFYTSGVQNARQSRYHIHLCQSDGQIGKESNIVTSDLLSARKRQTHITLSHSTIN